MDTNVVQIVVKSNTASGKGEIIKTIEEALKAKYPELQVEIEGSIQDQATVLLTSRVVISEGISTPALGVLVDSIEQVQDTPNVLQEGDVPAIKASEKALHLFNTRHQGKNNAMILYAAQPDGEDTIRLSYASGLYTMDTLNDSFTTSDQEIMVELFRLYAEDYRAGFEHWAWTEKLSHPGTYLSWTNNAAGLFTVQLHEQNGKIRVFLNQGVDKANTEFSTDYESLDIEQVLPYLRERFPKLAG